MIGCIYALIGQNVEPEISIQSISEHIEYAFEVQL
jgi:hypothetical protein